jgi:DNA polymerase (family 10)
VENAQIASIFEEIADLLELKGGNEFRVRSYRNAARTVRDLSRRVEDLVEEGEKLSDLPNIGKGTAEKIDEILHRGTCRRLEELRKEVPPQLTELMKIPQLGPRKAMELHKELDIGSVEDLKKACEEHRVRDLEGMGAKTEENILKGIRTLETTKGRHLYSTAAEYVETVGRHLDAIPAIQAWEVAGSFRRRKETIGDLDILIRTRDRAETTEKLLEYDAIDEVIGRGEERVSVRLRNHLQIDFRFFDAKAFGAAMLYFTGSKSHNIALRKRVQQRGWKLNEYGLFKGDNYLAGKTEKAVYKRLNLPWIPPELREDTGELEAAEEDRLPRLIGYGDIRGDLQCHTKASDGANTIQEMAEEARSRNYEYLAITDHSKTVTVANGLDEERLKKHADEIRKADDSIEDLWLMAGIEVDILKSGKLDLDEKALAELDWVLATVHYHLNLSRKDMTERLLRAVRSGVVHCLGHPTSRMIGKRDPIAYDFDEVFEACRENGVFLEIDAQPDRLDLSDTLCKRAVEAGNRFTISTDAHKRSDLDFISYGIAVARRGWLSRGDVLNTVSASTLKKRIRRK